MPRRRRNPYRRMLRHHPRNVIPGSLFTLFVIIVLAAL